MKYNVHVYATVRVKVLDVEAKSQREAIKGCPFGVFLTKIRWRQIIGPVIFFLEN